MIYNEAIQKALYAWFTQRLNMEPYHKGWLRGDCPNPTCRAIGKFGVNLFHNRSNCFKCGSTTRPITIVMDIEGLTTYHEVRALLTNYSSETFSAFQRKQEVKESPKQKSTLSLPEGYKLLIFGDSQLAKSARAYIKGRGFNIRTLSYQGIGYCDKGIYLGCIIFPFYYEGKLIYFQARRYIELGEKFQNPDSESFGVGKSELIWNRDALYTYRKIRLMESVTNCLTLGTRGVGILGKKASPIQISTLIQAPVEEYNIILDPDALKEAIGLAYKLIPYKIVKISILPEGQDVNSYGKEKTLKIIKEAEPLTYGKLATIKSKYL